MNAYIAHQLEVSLSRLIRTAAAQVDMKALDLLLAATNEAIEDPDWDGDIGDLSTAYTMGEVAGVIGLIMRMIEPLDDAQINALKIQIGRN